MASCGTAALPQASPRTEALDPALPGISSNVASATFRATLLQGDLPEMPDVDTDTEYDKA